MSFGIPYRPTGRKSALPGSSPVILLRMPAELRDAIQAEAEPAGVHRQRRRPARARRRARRPLQVQPTKGKQWPPRTARRTAARARTTRSASRSSASATAPTRSSRASSTTRTPPDDQFVPGLMHVNLGGYHIRDIEFVAAFDVVKGKVGVDLAEAIWAHPNDTIKFADVPKTGIKVSRGMTHDGIGKYLSRGRREGARRDRRRRRDPQGDASVDVVVNYLPVGSEEATKWYAEQILDGRLRDGELHAGLHRARAVLAAPLRAGRRADHRRRHQVAGRRHDHAPRADDALPRARRAPRQDDAAERRRQLRLPQHARARAPRVEEDLEDERGHVDARLRHRRRATSTSARPTTCRG